MMYHRIGFNYSKLVVCFLAAILVSCSSTRHLEKKQNGQVYKALGLQKDRNDNFALYKESAYWLNVPHREGGLSLNGIDCSGLVYNIYKKVYNKILERNSEKIFQKNCSRISQGRLREGDLVFFNSGSGRNTRSNINHVGIYLKENKFLHTSTSRGVMVSNLDEPYYRKIWVSAGRVK